MPAFLGTNAAKFLARASGNAGKRSISPVPGTTVLSLSGHPLTLSRSREIAKAPGPADVRERVPDVCGP